MAGFLVLGALASWALFALAALMAGARNGEWLGGLMLGIFLGPFGLLLALLSQGNRVRCKMCRELVRAGAWMCPHCHTKWGPPEKKEMAT